jgi:hypothetical protein
MPQRDVPRCLQWLFIDSQSLAGNGASLDLAMVEDVVSSNVHLGGT